MTGLILVMLNPAKYLILLLPGTLFLTACVYVPSYESRGVTTAPETAAGIDEPGYLYDYPGGYGSVYRYGYYLPYPLHGLHYPVLIGGSRPRPSEPADPGDAPPGDQTDAGDTPDPRARPRGARPRDVVRDDRTPRTRARVRAAPKASPPPVNSASPSSARGTPTRQDGPPRDQR